jgi:ATP/maltotriose-dependent transcriptional regulator MalT
MYGGVTEIGAPSLALTNEETSAVLGSRPDLERLVTQAEGWPAVVALAAGLQEAPARDAIPSMLHRYVADELFRSAPAALQEVLLTLALSPSLKREHVEDLLGPDWETTLAAARDRGFIVDDERHELHPLLREFLLSKLADDGTALPRIREAVGRAVDFREWDVALNLVTRFRLLDLVDPLLRTAFRPLVRAGRLGTLSSFSVQIRDMLGFPPPAVHVIDAEVALRDGQFELAQCLANRAIDDLPEGHELRSPALQISARIHFFAAEFPEGATAYEQALVTALDEEDRTESIFGLGSVLIFGEMGDPVEATRPLFDRRHQSADHLLR